jgi:hypothetical protein
VLQQNALGLEGSNAGHSWWSDGPHHQAISTTAAVSGMSQHIHLQPVTESDLVISMLNIGGGLCEPILAFIDSLTLSN